MRDRVMPESVNESRSIADINLGGNAHKANLHRWSISQGKDVEPIMAFGILREELCVIKRSGDILGRETLVAFRLRFK